MLQFKMGEDIQSINLGKGWVYFGKLLKEYCLRSRYDIKEVDDLIKDLEGTKKKLKTMHSVIFLTDAILDNTGTPHPRGTAWIMLHNPEHAAPEALHSKSVLAAGTFVEARFAQNPHTGDIKLAPVIGSHHFSLAIQSLEQSVRILTVLGMFHGAMWRTSGTTKLTGAQDNFRSVKAYILTDYLGEALFPKIQNDTKKEAFYVKGDDTHAKLMLFAEYLLSATEHLAFLHEKGVVHRDIKPQNAVINGAGKIFLIDFGFSIILPAGVEKVFINACGSNGFVDRTIRKDLKKYENDPQNKGKAVFSSETDMYAFGIFALMLLPPHMVNCKKKLYYSPHDGEFEIPSYPASMAILPGALNADEYQAFDTLLGLINACEGQSATLRPTASVLAGALKHFIKVCKHEEQALLTKPANFTPKLEGNSPAVPITESEKKTKSKSSLSGGLSS